MPTNGRLNRRRAITVGVILAVAVAGLLAINTDRAGADLSVAAIPSVTAASGTDTTPAGERSPMSVVPSLFKMISALVVVVICIYAGIYLLKRLMGRRYSGNRPHNVLEVLETTYVAPKRTISLVRVADRSVLVGVTDSQITVLTELDAEKTAAIVAADVSEATSDSFRDMLSKATRKMRELTLKRQAAALETVVKAQQQ